MFSEIYFVDMNGVFVYVRYRINLEDVVVIVVRCPGLIDLPDLRKTDKPQTHSRKT